MARGGETGMRRIGLAAVLAISGVAAIAADKPTQFWNLTTGTIMSYGSRTRDRTHMATMSRSATPMAWTTTSARKS